MKNFFDTKDEKITDKAFSQSIAISVLGIFLCIIMLSSITYAWFVGGTESSTNTLKAGCFDFDIAVTQDENGTVKNIDVNKNADGTSSCTFEDVGKYTVVLTMTDASTVKGFCCVKIGDGAEAQTISMTKESNGTQSSITTFSFTLDITTQGQTVLFTPKWGLPANAQIEAGSTYPKQAGQGTP